MRNPILAIALLALQPAYAETIAVSSRVTEVTMHPDSAAILRRAEVSLPAGRHRLVLQGVPASAVSESLRVEVEGARQTGTLLRQDRVPPRDADTPEIDAARQRIEEIEDRIRGVEDDARRARLAGSAAEASLTFLRGLGENEGLAEAGPDTLRDIARMIRDEAGAAGAAALDAEIAARRIEDQLSDLRDELKAAQQALAALTVEDEDRLFIAIEVDAPEAADATVTLRYLVRGATYWTPAYDLRLATGDAPSLTLERSALVRQTTGENWTDVALHLSTLAPVGRAEPNALLPLRLRIGPPEAPVRQSRSQPESDGLASLVAPALEAPAPPPPLWKVAEGPGVTYSYAVPVSIASSADLLRLRLDSLSQPAQERALAVPFHDQTAFHMARVEDGWGEELLPSQYAARYVDGVLVGTSGFPGLAAGQEAEFGFGPIDGLRIKRDVLDQSEGDRGLINRSSERNERVEIEVENLTGRDWPLRVLDRVPYSEQEDLEIWWTASPRPDEDDVDKQRGILAWDFDLGTGDTRTIRIDTTLTWPEGMVLR
ncbi:conserved hypothetical protein [Cribrihabitans marinus]|uniref:Mucoidy inhibitor MuiA family protein n=1 Tax=Cribrihabitans marinus TaxID=1227549 RepID=A0A1H7C1G8_9RHOB|nr:DUF4139 domain-containing protein [Cribrihabitans marinus]GGH33306.1 hypothetical protein GCM10010973_25310 [Cribrihabitans marinus]SEJ82407.1 conserved hypothetical protein [Cribrihabitans marinus]